MPMSGPNFTGFDSSIPGLRLANASGARKLQVATFGESHGGAIYLGSAIQDACWRLYNADINYDTRYVFNGTGDTATTLFPVGSGTGNRGKSYATGGSTTVHLLNYQVPQAVADQAANPMDIAFIQSGYNDQGSPDNYTITGRVISAANALLAAGYKYVVIGGISPRAQPAVNWQGYNTILRRYVDATPNTFFMDVSSVLGDFNLGSTSSAYRDIGTYTAGNYNSMTDDGTHWAMRAQRAVAVLIAGIFQQICAKRTPRQTFNAGRYNPTTNRDTNILGDAGNMQGTGGYLNSVANAGIAGPDASSRLLMYTNGSGLTVTPSIITGSVGERKQRISLAGSTSTTSASIEIDVTPVLFANADGGDSTLRMDSEAVINLTGVTGLAEIQIRHGSSGTDFYSLAIGNNAGSTARPDLTTEDLFIYSMMPVKVPASTSPLFSLMFFFANGKTPVGTIDISRWSAMLVNPS